MCAGGCLHLHAPTHVHPHVHARLPIILLYPFLLAKRGYTWIIEADLQDINLNITLNIGIMGDVDDNEERIIINIIHNIDI